MKDRTSKYPGRVQLVPVEGMPNTYTMTWADEPMQEGTPLNKANLLSDTVAAALRLGGDDPTVNDALHAIATGMSSVTVSDREPTSSDAGYPGHLWIYTGLSGKHIYIIKICVGQDSAGYIWKNIVNAERKLKTEVFRSSTVWTAPAEIAGNVSVMVYGGGGCGGNNSSSNTVSGAGGGGGCMSEWVGVVPPGESVNVTVGSGGKGGTGSGNNAGGSSAFGPYVSAAGGSGGYTYTGGAGGSGGGAGYGGTAGAGSQFGSGGTPKKSSTAVDGVDTTKSSIYDLGKGDGKAGDNDSSNRGGGGGGGYGGKGGNGIVGGGGGGGYGSSGNGGDGCSAVSGTAGMDGGIGAGGGGGRNNAGGSGSGGDGIVIVSYYVLEGV